MFKLESYLTPWLLGYLDKYVKLKPEDFQLSLWGGDAVFNNLDLRLNVVEELANIPIKFKSGLIHELRIHIPWTRITSESVVVTINTLEFVAKLKDHDSSSSQAGNTTGNSSFGNQNVSADESMLKEQQQQQQQQMPAGYIQNIITKILFNIQLIVNNVIIKFVEEDMVLSFNMKSAECFSVNSKWEKIFISEINNSRDFHLRKILQLNDVTICLDKLESKTNNKINFYQDPLIYRFSIESRLDLHYTPITNSNNSNPANNFNQQLKTLKFNFYCKKFDISITDQQLPMVIRLIELIVAILNGNLKLPEAALKSSESPQKFLDLKNPSLNSMQTSAQKQMDTDKNEVNRQNQEDILMDVQEDNGKENQSLQQEQQEGWLSWAWSYVPSVTNMLPLNESNSSEIQNENPKQIEIFIGFYVDQIVTNFKLFQQLNQQQQHHQKQQKSSTFSPFLLGQLRGLAVEINSREDFAHTMIGISHVSLKSVGECCCKLSPKTNLNESLFIHAGNELELDEKTFHYLSGSLFDISDESLNVGNLNMSDEAQLISTDIVVNADSEIPRTPVSLFDKNKKSKNQLDEMIDEKSETEYNQENEPLYLLPSSRDKQGRLDENYGHNRFGAIFIDNLFKSANLNKSMRDEVDDPLEDVSKNLDEDVNIKEEKDVFSLCLLFYGLNINLSADFLHRAFKVFDCSQKHSYTHVYANDPYEFLSQNNANVTDELSVKQMVETMAKKFEKYVPLFNETFTFKDPVIRFYPYSHSLLTTTTNQLDSNYDCFLNITVKYIFVNLTMPLNEMLLFDVVSKLTNPSKKLIYDSYIHNQITIDTLKVNLTINELMTQYNAVKSHEFPLLEPCFFELHFSNVIMPHKMWNKQYFPLTEFVLELPILKLNLQKHMLFIVNDYVDNYLIPVLNKSIFDQINKPSISKAQSKQARLRQIIFKRLLEDFVQQSYKKKSEILSICINDLKLKYSLTKIMHVFQLNCNMCNIFLLKSEQTDNLVPLLQTSNKVTGKSRNIKDFLVVRAQLPLNIDANNSYIPDPLFVYANLNEINIQIRNELISWLSYKPRGDDELLSLLLLDLFEDDSIETELNENFNKSKHSASSLNKFDTSLDFKSPQASTIYKHNNTSNRSNRSISVSSQQSSLKNKKFPAPSNQVITSDGLGERKRIHHQKTLSNIAGAKPTIIDTYYDLLKSLHLQISVKPVTIAFKITENPLDLVVAVLPQIDFKSTGTKCDLEEELITSKLVELPCSSLRACEKTSNKLPWIVDFKGFQIYHYQLEANERDDFTISLFKSDKKYFFVGNSDLNSVFSIKPKYHNHDNLLSSLTAVFAIEIGKKTEMNLGKSYLSLIIDIFTVLENTVINFKQKIDYAEFNVKQNQQPNDSNNNNNKFENPITIDWDENKSYSQISILKEYDLSSLDDEENQDFDMEESGGTDYIEKHEVCYLSGDEVSSSSSSMAPPFNTLEMKELKRKQSKKTNIKRNQASRNVSPTIYIMREKNEEQVQLNFTILFSLSNLSLNLINESSKTLTNFSIHKMNIQLELSKTLQKCLFRLKKFEIKNELKDKMLNNVIFTSDADVMNKKLFRHKIENKNMASTPDAKPFIPNKSEQIFLEITFTRTLLSHLNKKLKDLSSGESGEKFKRPKLKNKNFKKNTSENKWISEVNLALANFDLMLHVEKFDTLIEFYIDLINLLSQKAGKSTNQAQAPPNNANTERLSHYLIPLIKAKEIPLLNIDISNVRIIFPFNDKLSKAEDIIIAQMVSLNLTSQFENPLVRNFLNNSVSLVLYNKAKSSGNLYKPGFEFEDRQYSLDIKDLALFRTKFVYLTNQSKLDKYSSPILENFDLKAILGLPILLDRRLINGYTLEISIPTTNLSLYFGNFEVNLVYNILNQNLDTLNYKLKSLNTSNETKLNAISNETNSELKILPMDILLTAENINVYFYTLEVSHTKVVPLMWLQFIQPHTCLIMHENLQKFEVSIFDFILKRSTTTTDELSSGSNGNFEENEYALPQNSDFVVPLIETKPGEPNSKTGVLNGAFSMKFNNFAHLFCHENKDKNLINGDQIEDLICVCNECLRCFEFKSNQNSLNKSSSEGHSLTTQIYIERPLRLKANIVFFSQIKNFLETLNFLKPSANLNEETKQETSAKDNEKCLIAAQEPIKKVQFLFDLNVHILTSQIVVGLELDYKNFLNINSLEKFNTNILFASFSSLNLFINRISNDDHEREQTSAVGENSRKKIVNNVSFHLSDFQSKMQLINENNKENIHFLGPTSIKTNFVYLLDENELYSNINLGSVFVTLNKKLIDFFSHLSSYLFKNESKEETNEILSAKTSKKNECSLEFIKHDDDLRNGAFKYTVIDENFLKISSHPDTNNLWLMSHVRLPNVNEIICVDDMPIQSLKSTISWRYSTRRAIINLRLLPLPFVGVGSVTMVENKNDSTKQLKCYLEYLNECTKCFCIVKEFTIEEGNYTNVLKNLSGENMENLVFSKVWRIRLSNEAKRFIYASSLLASCLVDSIELNKVSFHSHVEFSCDNIEVKLNTINLVNDSSNAISTADLFSINLNELAFKVLLNNCKSLKDEAFKTNVVVNCYGQLSVDYCEYRFLTMRSIVDAFQFKLTSSLSLMPILNIALNLDLSTVNVLVSQSAFIAVKQLENEWKTCNNITPQYYLIYNDTDMNINVKQFDTEETCLIKPGNNLAYTWRTHKKVQLMQFYLPKYKLISKAFQINEDGPQELVFDILISNSVLKCLIFVESAASLLSQMHQTSESAYLKKKIFIQSKLIICNYLNVALDDFYLSYYCNGKMYEINLNNSIKELSRSQSTYELIQSNEMFEIHTLKVNQIEITKRENEQLKSGVLCRDKSLNISFWLNFYEQAFSSKNGSFTQYNLIFTPIFVFCSYLPFELSVEILNSNVDASLIKSNSISYLSSSNENSNELTIKFDQVFGNSQALNSISAVTNSKNWYEKQNAKLLTKTNFNVSCCNSSKRLVFSNLFKYMMQDSHLSYDDMISLNIFTPFMTESAKLGTHHSHQDTTQNTNTEKILSIGDDRHLSEFEIIKKTCWPFSKTIRIDLKPICLFVNKTCYYIKIKEQSEDNKQNVYFLNSNGGQLCMSNLGITLNDKNEEIYNKKYKFSITLDEYSVPERLVSGAGVGALNDLDLKKNTIEYESEWFDISQEQVTPFYREKHQYKQNRLFLNKCWLDLKLYPNEATRKEAKFKLIYLVLQSDEFSTSHETFINNQEKSSGAGDKNLDSVSRIVTINTKFLFNNKTKFDLKLQVEDDFLTNNETILPRRFIESSTDDEDCQITVDSLYSTGNIINKNNFYIKNEIETTKEEDEYLVDKENLNDLYYLKIIALGQTPVKLSKPLVLTVKEKAIKQILSNGQLDDTLLISRQCFCLYTASSPECKSFIIAQKLLVNKNGRLIIVLREDQNYLVNFYNCLDVDIYVWPRLSTNFIFENYIKNVNAVNEKLLVDYKAKNMLEKNQGRSKSSSSSKNVHTIDNIYERSLVYMHRVPAKKSLKFNYDFIGTNLYPIENLREQIFFMFGLLSQSSKKKFDFDGKPYELSPNLCRIYDANFEIGFERKNLPTFYYLGNSLDNLNQMNVNRYITHERSDEFFKNSPKETCFFNELNICFGIERFTLALNDDYLSQVYQTEIIRLTCDYFNLNLKNLKVIGSSDDDLVSQQLDKKLLINFNCAHFQLDNQMFDLDLNETFASQKYDFPVIVIPRDSKKYQIEPQNAIKNLNYFKSLDSFHYFEQYGKSRQHQKKSFFDVNLLFVCNKKSNNKLMLLDVDLDLSPLDIYLEDYLIYNLIQIGMSYLNLISVNYSNENNDDYISDISDENLDIIILPLILLRQINISSIDALVSLQTSIKVYLATYRMPIFFESFKITGFPMTVMSSPQLVKLFTSHYLTSLLFRAGWLLGSLDLIGTPTAFIQQVSNGVYDFLQMPYNGLRNSGPTGLLHGLSNGSLSLIKNLSAGTLTSFTSFAAFVSRNMDILSCDEFHIARQDQLRHHGQEASFGSGVLQVSSSFLITIMGAIGGLAEQPLQTINTSDSLIKGVSKGLIGLVTKPVGAVAELFNQTGQGLLKITGGTNRIPSSELRLQRRALNKEFSRFTISYTKCLWKLISSTPISNSIHINSIIDAVYTIDENNKTNTNSSNTYNLTGCYLILTDEILYIIDKNDDMLLRAFYLSQIDIDIKKNHHDTYSNNSSYSSSVLVVTLNSQKVELFLNEYQKAYENAFDRVVEYLVESSRISNELQVTPRHSPNESKSISHISTKGYEAHLPDYFKFSKLILNNFLNSYSELPCVCGSLIYALNKVDNKLGKPNSSSHVRQISTTENSSNRHVRHASNTDMPRIHRIRSTISLAGTQQSINSLQSIKSSSNDFNFQQQSQAQSQQQFFYYVDPRFSYNFISIFNSIKRKITNKGFQF